MIDSAAIEAAGYKRWNQAGAWSGTDIFYQKRVRDGNGDTKYFINVLEYDWRDFGHNTPFKDFSYVVKVQFSDSEEHCINIELSCCDFDNIADVEKKIDNIFVLLDGINYE